jgi:hypothetical protein
MPNPPLDEVPDGVFELDATPSLDDVLLVRDERMNRVAELVEGVEPAELHRQVQSPNGGDTNVLHCLLVVFSEEWSHDQYANRDLAILESR